jgi:ABC-2 type transport system permease protein
LNAFWRMTRALLYLRAMSMLGAVRSRLQRLKQPKYLLGALVGIAYFYFIFSRPGRGAARSGGPRDGATQQITPEMLELFGELAAAALIIVLVLTWLIPRRASLTFSEAEIAFLFPAPVSRRMLIHYRILSSQVRLALTALILMLVFRRGAAFGQNAATHAIGWWLMLATLNLHLTGASFIQTRLLNLNITPWRRTAAFIGVALVVLGGFAAWGWNVLTAATAEDLRSAETMITYLSAQLERGPLPWLLAIPRLIVAPLFATDTTAFLWALGPALLVLLVHYFWVVNTEVSFEEASIASAEKRTTRQRAFQQGDWSGQTGARKAQKPPFRLGDTGMPEIAFLWKNLLSTSAFFNPRNALVGAGVIAVAAAWLGSQPGFEAISTVVSMMSLAFAALMLVMGAQVARQDLRADLLNADVLKTYPLRGAQVVLGELLTPVVTLTVCIWISLIAAVLTFPANFAEGRLAWLTTPWLAAAATGVAVLTPPFCALQLLVPNALTVLFPAWVQLVGNRSEHGLDVLGQRILFFVGQMLFSAVTLVPAALASGVVFLATQWIAGAAIAAVVAVVALFGVLSLEAWLGIQWLGRRFEDFDSSAELKP